MTKPQPAPEAVRRQAAHYAPYARAGAFDEGLGDAGRPDLPFSPGRLHELDAREAFPTRQTALLDELGLPGYYVPERHGGRLRSHEDLLHLVRMVARRDLTVAIAHTKTYLGAVSTWVGGSPEQARALGARVAAGAVVSWALTEREHGSDLLSGALTATRTEDGRGYRLDGEKWLINNATRAELICVLARTAPEGGTRGYSLLLVDKTSLAPGTYTCLPAARTHGIRGADISGISFAGAEVPASALIGDEGAGIEIVLRALQITRTLCAALSLGAGDQALRIATGFGLEHRLYDKRLIDLPQARRDLTEAYADLLTMEAVTLVAGRGMHTLTEEMSVTSSVVKYLVPTTVDELVRDMGQVLGARSFLSDAYADGMFPKLERDHRIVGIFDGNTLVNLNALINQFGSLARGYRAARTDQAGLDAAAGLGTEVPEFDPARLVLTSRTGNSVVASLPAGVARLRDLAAEGAVPGSLVTRAERVLAVTDETHRRMAAHRPTPRDVPAAAFHLAGRYTLCTAAAACVQLFLRNRESALTGTGTSAGLWHEGLWLEACLSRLLVRLGPGRRPEDEATDEVTVETSGTTTEDATGTATGRTRSVPADPEAVLDRLMPFLHGQFEAGDVFSLLSFAPAAEPSPEPDSPEAEAEAEAETEAEAVPEPQLLEMP